MDRLYELNRLARITLILSLILFAISPIVIPITAVIGIVPLVCSLILWDAQFWKNKENAAKVFKLKNVVLALVILGYIALIIMALYLFIRK